MRGVRGTGPPVAGFLDHIPDDEIRDGTRPREPHLPSTGRRRWRAAAPCASRPHVRRRPARAAWVLSPHPRIDRGVKVHPTIPRRLDVHIRLLAVSQYFCLTGSQGELSAFRVSSVVICIWCAATDGTPAVQRPVDGVTL